MLKRVILELGTGNDLHGSDYTKAALRAVQDALHHSSLSVVRTLGLDPNKLHVEVTIGVQQPGRVDAAAVKASLPRGTVTVKVVKGGLNVPAEGGHDEIVIASAAIAARLELD
jgi:uncharacterized protein (TIGR02058 family)